MEDSGGTPQQKAAARFRAAANLITHTQNALDQNE
jgi:hypothetical protein